MIEDNTPHTRRTLFAKYKQTNTTFFETGTHLGNGVEHALQLGFDTIVSAEINEDFYKHSCKRFKSNSNVHLFHGDSVDLFDQMADKINGPTLFWLDAHINSGEIVFSELAKIHNLPKKHHTILIDDIPVYFQGSLDRLVYTIKEINPDYHFILEHAINEDTGQILRNYDLAAYLD
jgi:hypothetical protein